MLTMILSTDWIAGRNSILQAIASDVHSEKEGCILLVPELISHDMERRLCKVAGDTSSRFAEVLSFTRLAKRVSENLNVKIPDCLDNGGRLVAMAAAAMQLHNKLKAYASVETKPEFLCELVDAIDEFKCCCIGPADLKNASEHTEGSLAQKLEELSLLFEAYEAICQQGKRDPRDQMNWLLEELEASDFATKHHFYVDGFPDFTRQHLLILEHLIASGTDVTISMNCDTPGSSDPAFEKAGHTAKQLILCANRAGIPVAYVTVSPENTTMPDIGRQLFSGRIVDGIYKEHLRVFTTVDIYEECCLVADRILALMSKGVRYRDISVVCGDMELYKSTLTMVFRRCGIPCYLSGTEDILDRSILNTVLTALDAAVSGFEQREVLRYAKSLLSPLSLESCDKLENYAIFWSINGSKWKNEWTNHPYELGGKWTEAAKKTLHALNESRQSVMTPLVKLRDGICNATCLKQQVTALYRFLEEIAFAQKLDQLAKSFEQSGEFRDAQIVNQLWEILLLAIEQLYDVIGQTNWSEDTFVRMFKLLLSQYDVGTIPPVLDSVTVGPISAMRCQESKHLFVLGALEGTLPAFSTTSGVLNDQDRNSLRKLGVPVNGGSEDNLQVDFAEIYGSFNGARETVTVSCPSGQPSYVFQRLGKLAGGVIAPAYCLGAVLTDRREAAAYLARWNDEKAAADLCVQNEYHDIIRHREHTLGLISKENIAGLYGHKLMLSASQIDKQADCRMEYFCKYGLHLKERKSASVDPSEFGTYVHDVLENTAKKVMELGGFKAVSLDQITDIAIGFSDAYAADHFGELESERISYLFRRNAQELKLVVQELWQEMQTSDFIPIGFEVGFGRDEQMPAICVSGKDMEAYLGGYVDRVDSWDAPNIRYFRVVDYKTGKKNFDYCDVLNGIGLQMLLYLFALEENGHALLGDKPQIAGVQYFPSRFELLSTDGMLTDEELEKERLGKLTRKGLILNDEDVLHAMENTDSLKRLSCKRLKDGSLSGDLADTDQFRVLKQYVFHLVGKFVDDIASGNVTPNPYTRGTYHNACAFCPYGAICHKEQVEGRRNYKAVKAKQFWESVYKEVKDNG